MGLSPPGRPKRKEWGAACSFRSNCFVSPYLIEGRLFDLIFYSYSSAFPFSTGLRSSSTDHNNEGILGFRSGTNSCRFRLRGKELKVAKGLFTLIFGLPALLLHSKIFCFRGLGVRLHPQSPSSMKEKSPKTKKRGYSPSAHSKASNDPPFPSHSYSIIYEFDYDLSIDLKQVTGLLSWAKTYKYSLRKEGRTPRLKFNLIRASPTLRSIYLIYSICGFPSAPRSD